MRVRLFLPALVTAAALALSGCGTGGQSGTTAAAAVSTLNFTGTTLDGKKFDAAGLKGKPVVLWFWAPWCATCAQEADTLKDVAPKYAGKLDIVGVAGMGKESEMRQFVADYKIGNFPQIADGEGAIWKKFGITEQSVYVLIDSTGKVTHKDWIDYQNFTKVFDDLAKT
jgi:thiol-disulfide isomerase/thioredoxin